MCVRVVRRDKERARAREIEREKGEFIVGKEVGHNGLTIRVRSDTTKGRWIKSQAFSFTLRVGLKVRQRQDEGWTAGRRKTRECMSGGGGGGVWGVDAEKEQKVIYTASQLSTEKIRIGRIEYMVRVI